MLNNIGNLSLEVSNHDFQELRVTLEWSLEESRKSVQQPFGRRWL